MRTFGVARLDGRLWQLELEPHVAMRVKRVFASVKQRRGTVTLTNTDTNCRDLAWFIERYPVEISDADSMMLEDGARRFDERNEVALQILSGARPLAELEMLLPPREYQQRAAELAYNSGGLLLADDLGLGKTVAGITLLAMPETLPAIVVCPVHLQRQWQSELWRFMRLDAHIVRRTEPYDLAKDDHDPEVVILSYAKLSGWRDVLAASHFRTVIFDECQELRRTDSKKYRAAEHVSSAVTYRLGLSATPIYNYGIEYHAVLNVISPGALGTVHEFLREWCTEGFADKARVREPRAFGAWLRETSLMLRRTRWDVGRELPALTRLVEHVDCDREPLDSAESHATELAEIILSRSGHSNSERWTAAGEFDMRLRQATGIAKAPYVADFVRMLLADGDPVVLFGWHRAVYDLWLDRLKDFKPALYTGSESPNQKHQAVERFTAGDTRLLIMSLRSGSGVDGLQHVCQRAVIGELDWSPGAIEQCIGRVHRDGQVEPVFAYYLVSPGGSDPTMADVLQLKRGQMEGVRDPDAEITEQRQVDPDHVKKLAEAYLARRKA